MAQHDYVIANGTGAAVRSDLNNALAAIVSQNSGATEPATMYAYQWWADTTTGLLKLRNGANNAWITLRELDGTLTIEAGTVSAPGLAFASDLNTGVWSPGADQFAIATNGVERVEWGTSEVVFNDGGANYDFRVEGDTNANLLFVDASADAVGIGNSSPSEALTVSGKVQATTEFKSETGNDLRLNAGSANRDIFMQVNGSTLMTVQGSTGRVGIGTASAGSALQVNGAGGIRVNEDGAGTKVVQLRSDYASSGPAINVFTNDPLLLLTNNTERARIDSSGRLLVGTSSARSNFYNDTNSASIQLESASNDGSALALIQNFNANTLGGQLILAKSNSASVGSNTLVASGDACGRVSFQGNDGTQFVEAAQIRCDIDGTPGANDMPGRLVFSTTADGASSPTARIIINSAGTLYPATDNAFQAGSSGYRWTAIYAVNGTIQTSDARQKTDVSSCSLGSAFIKSLQPVSFKWIEGGNTVTKSEDGKTDVVTPVPGERTHWGFLAQDVKAAVDNAGVDFGGWILTDKDDPDSDQGLRYDQFIAPLTKALQETMAELEALKVEVAALKAQ